ncbi:hypothetical protein EMCRGX_G008579 [Ephydatia muelleri]
MLLHQKQYTGTEKLWPAKRAFHTSGLLPSVGCEELADDVLVLHQLKSGLECNLNAKYSSVHPGAEIQDLPPGAALLSYLAN